MYSLSLNPFRQGSCDSHHLRLLYSNLESSDLLGEDPSALQSTDDAVYFVHSLPTREFSCIQWLSHQTDSCYAGSTSVINQARSYRDGFTNIVHTCIGLMPHWICHFQSDAPECTNKVTAVTNKHLLSSQCRCRSP